MATKRLTKRFFYSWSRLPMWVMLLAALCAHEARATDYSAANASGSWTDPSAWSPNGVPGNGDSADIGTTGAALSAYIALGGNQSVDNVFISADSAATSGTLDLNGYQLTANYNIVIGEGGGSGTLMHNGGSFSTPNLSLYSASSLVMVPADTVSQYVTMSDGSQLTTTSTGNLPGSAIVNGSTLTLGAPLTLGNQLDVEQYSTLNMANFPVNAYQMQLGWSYGQPVTLLNRAPITATYLQVAAETFNLSASDSVANFSLSNAAGTLYSPVSSLNLSNTAQATTTVAGNVSGSVDVNTQSALTLGASLTLSGNLDVDQNSTLDMAGYPISANAVFFGTGGTQTITLLNRAPITASLLEVGNMPFDLSASDSVTNFSLSNGTSTLHSPVSSLSLSSTSQAVTTAAGNVTGSVAVGGGSTLMLGAPLTLGGQLDVEQYSTLDMRGQPLNAFSVYLGWSYAQPVTVLNRAPITATYLYVASIPFDLSASDSVTNFSLSNGTSTLDSPVSSLSLNSAQAVTTPAGNVTGSVEISGSSTLTLGASLSLSGNLDLEQSSTLNMAGFPVKANAIYLGATSQQPVTVLNRAPITANYLTVGSFAFNLNAVDTVTNFTLNGGTSTLYSPVSTLTLNGTNQTLSSAVATTTASGSVTGSVFINGGSVLTLGAPLTLGDTFDLEQNSTLDMGGHPLDAYTVDLGWTYAQPVTVLNRAPIMANSLNVSSMAFDLLATDAVTNYSLSNGTSTLYSPVSSLTLTNSAQATTTAAGNVTGSVSVGGSSTLTLGAPLTLSGNLDLEQSSTLNMAGNAVSAQSFYVGWSTGPVTLFANGPISANYLYVGTGSTLSLTSGSDAIDRQITLSGASLLAVQPASGATTGLTLNGASAGALTVNDTSVLQLTAGSASAGGASWLFRWQDSGNVSWESALSALIAAGRITVAAPAGYSVFDQEGYTYIGAGTTLEWNGGGAGNNWSSAANWGGAAPLPGQWLRFGPLTAGGHASNTNDIAGSPLFYGILFDSQAPSYTLQGNAIQLSGDVLNQSSNNQEIDLDLQLVPGNGAFNTNTITFDTGANNITVAGSIGGTGMALEKTGSGSLILSGTNTYDGGTIVEAGTLILDSSSAIAEGSSLTVGGDAAAIFAPLAGGAEIASAATALSPVPEPPAACLLAAALCGAAVYRRVRHFVLQIRSP